MGILDEIKDGAKAVADGIEDHFSHEKSGPTKAKIKILTKADFDKEFEQITFDNPDEVLYVQLNPNKVQITDGVTYDKATIDSKSYYEVAGRRVPIQQYSMHSARELSIELLFDTYTSLSREKEKKDVKKEYIDKFLKLITNPVVTPGEPPVYGTPPKVFFSWGSIQFAGVITSMNYTYTMFTSEGKPVRATMNLVIKEYANLER